VPRPPIRNYVTRPVGPPPKPSSTAVSRSMQSNRGLGTKPELTLGRLLRRKILRSKLPGSPDFVYPRAKLAVFVHGCWWHRCPVDNLPKPKTHAAFWRRKFARNVERDRLNREELQSMGWEVIEIWEHEVKANPRACAERVLAEVRTRRRALALD
jgi:DNA mismatch endonuclease (patch repair protein)